MKIKLITLLLCLFTLTGKAIAQDYGSANTGEIKTLLGKHTKLRGFGSVDLKVSQWNEQTALLVGGHGGVILNNQFTIGLGGYGITTRSKFSGPNEQNNMYLGGGYGGLILGYSIFSKEVFHLNFPILFGGGGVDVLEDEDNVFSNGFDNIIESSGFFIVEPGLELEINVARFFKFAIGGSYRFIEGVNLDNVRSSSLDDWSTHVSFKFGKF